MLEFVYLDLKDPNTGEWYINPAIFNKDEVTHVQDFRVGDVMGTDGQVHRVRGYSGWYFHATENTAQTDVNATQQDEGDPARRNNWVNFVDKWYDRPQSVVPPVHDGKEFYNLDYLWKGLPEFGGHLHFMNYSSTSGGGGGGSGGGGSGGGGSTLPGGGFNDFVDGYGTYQFPGPINLSYLYGWQGDTRWMGETHPAMNHTMRFAMAGKCTVRLKGRTPIMGDWSPGGSWLPDGEDDKISIMPGQDRLIVIDGMRGIRVRTSGWFAHFGDHVLKKRYYDKNFVAFGSGNSVHYYNEGFSALCEGNLFGQSISKDPTSTQLAIAAPHHLWLKQWQDSNPNSGLDQYSLEATLKLWKVRPVDNINGTTQRVPDPYKVILGSSPYNAKSLDTPADAVVYTKASAIKTVHEFDPNHATNGGNCNPDYAESIAFIFNLPETRSAYAYCHLEVKHKGHIINSGFGKSNFNSLGLVSSYDYTIQWRPTDHSIFPNYGGGLPIPSTERDPDLEGIPMNNWHQAMTVVMPFGEQHLDFLPTCGIYITTVGKKDVPYVVKSFTNVPENIAIAKKVTIDWGDGSPPESANSIGTSFTHIYKVVGEYKITTSIDYTKTPGSPPDATIPMRAEQTRVLVSL